MHYCYSLSNSSLLSKTSSETAAVTYDISIYDRLENDLTHDPPSGVKRRNKPPGQLNEEWLQQIIDCVTIQPEIDI